MSGLAHLITVVPIPSCDVDVTTRCSVAAVKPKKSLEETLASLGCSKEVGLVRQEQQPSPLAIDLKKVSPPKSTVMGGGTIEIAPAPQPFSQSVGTPSVITKMLQAPPVSSQQQQHLVGGNAVAASGASPSKPQYGIIRPKQFATMANSDDEEEALSQGGHQPPPHASFMSGKNTGTLLL